MNSFRIALIVSLAFASTLAQGNKKTPFNAGKGLTLEELPTSDARDEQKECQISGKKLAPKERDQTWATLKKEKVFLDFLAKVKGCKDVANSAPCLRDLIGPCFSKEDLKWAVEGYIEQCVDSGITPEIGADSRSLEFRDKGENMITTLVRGKDGSWQVHSHTVTTVDY